MSDTIDFVITWVDGNDPEWQEEMRSYLPEEDLGQGSSEERYREWDNLRYWFRGVERFAPWVRTVHLVTWGHVPSWLDLNHPKLHVVRHEDFVPAEYLPVFSAHPLEANLHRIPGLSERFVYFNDDMFLCAPVRPADFFHNGLPRDIAALNVHCNARSQPIQQICINNVGVINDHFDFHTWVRENRHKILDPRYGKLLARSLVLLNCPRFPGFFNPHAPQPFVRHVFDEVWEAEPELLREVCSHRFRLPSDVSQWVFKDWQIAKGGFWPRPASYSQRFFFVGDEALAEAQRAADCIRAGKTRMVCPNDGPMTSEDFEVARALVNGALDERLPQPSSFEVD